MFPLPTMRTTHALSPLPKPHGDWSNCVTAGSIHLNGWKWVDEPVPGYPKRPVPRDEAAAKELKKRTLTNLYNARPQWLTDAHANLDAAVAAAYGWPSNISDDEVLRKLLELNLARG